jgi:hypothetical protein
VCAVLKIFAYSDPLHDLRVHMPVHGMEMSSWIFMP